VARGFGVYLLGRAPVMDLEVSPCGITFHDTPEKQRLSWDQFTRWYTTPRLLVLEIGWYDALALPRRCCKPASWTELVEWVRVGMQ
jgi:hypothetical protein